MKVKELIEHLKTMPQELDVMVCGETGYESITKKKVFSALTEYSAEDGEPNVAAVMISTVLDVPMNDPRIVTVEQAMKNGLTGTGIN